MSKSLLELCRTWRLWKEESGQDLVEYSLLGALIAVACVAAINPLANAIIGAFNSMSAAL